MNWFRYAREELGLRQQDVATAAGCSLRTYCRIEAGEDMRVSTLHSVAAALQTPIGDLLPRTPTWITIDEAAARLGIDRSGVFRMAKRGDFGPFHPLGGTPRKSQLILLSSAAVDQVVAQRARVGVRCTSGCVAELGGVGGPRGGKEDRSGACLPGGGAVPEPRRGLRVRRRPWVRGGQDPPSRVRRERPNSEVIVKKENPLTNQLPRRVIPLDQRYEKIAGEAQEQLARLRWYWTLNEDNPERVSFRTYADAVGRSHTTIRSMANGYAAYRDSAGRELPSSRSLTDEIELGKLSERKRAATEALADAQGLTVANVASTQRDRVKDVVELATAAAERRGTTVDEEIPRAALSHHRTVEHEKRQRAERKKRHTMRYIEMEGHLAAAKQRLTDALKCAQDVEFDEEEAELIADSIRNVSAVLRMLDARFVGTSGTDWDAELARLGDAS